MLLTVLAFLVVIGVIVTIHELGHFVAAKLTGMRVNKFSIGFPPRIYSRKIGQTEFSISWIPLGGYVQIAGMVDESMDEDNKPTGAPDEFMSKSPLQKIFVLSAGVLMNYVIAFLLVAGLTIAIGTAHVAGTEIGEVMPNMPAEKAGVKPGDEIVAVSGIETPTWEKVVETISASGDTVALTVRQADTGERVDLAIPTELTKDGAPRRIIGITPQIEFQRAGPITAIRRGAQFCYGTTAGIVGFLGDLFTGRGSITQLAGPLGVAQLSGESARQGIGTFLFFLAYVSVSIGFLNILPLPVLDGGHIMYVLIESLVRRQIPARVKLWIQQVGVGLLILLVILVSYHDILRIFSR
jgi:regulator of sigma E protease